jgi:hypothetical protein
LRLGQKEYSTVTLPTKLSALIASAEFISVCKGEFGHRLPPTPPALKVCCGWFGEATLTATLGNGSDAPNPVVDVIDGRRQG